MKYILGVILILFALAFVGMLLPAIIGVVVGIGLIRSGSLIGGLTAIFVGIGINIGMLYGGSAGSGSSGGHSFIDDECPSCGIGDADGNHCYERDEDF